MLGSDSLLGILGGMHVSGIVSFVYLHIGRSQYVQNDLREVSVSRVFNEEFL